LICPRPRWGSLQCSPRPLAAFKGPPSRQREGGRWGKREGRVKEGGIGKGNLPPLKFRSGYATAGNM